MHEESSEKPKTCGCNAHTYIGKKKPWTVEEDEHLIRLVDKYGPQKWSTIADNMPGNYLLSQADLVSSVGKDGIII